jgi:hypothetical protein
MNEDEERVLRHLISLGGEEYRDFLDQVGAARVISVWFPGSLSFDVVVPSEQPLEFPHASVSNLHAWVFEPDGEVSGGMMLLTNGSVLGGLEYYWHGDELPRQYPPNDRMRLH